MKPRARCMSGTAVACLIVGLGALLLAASASAAWAPFINVVRQQEVGGTQVAMDPAGDTVFMWHRGLDGGIFTRVRAADGTLSPIKAIAGPGSNGVEYDVAVDSQGTAYYIWQAQNDQGFHYIRARVRHADGTLSPVQTLRTAKPGEWVRNPLVGVDASGSVVFAWFFIGGNDSTPRLLQARTRSASGSLGPVRTVAQDLSGATPTTMGVDSAGDATFMWEAGEGPGQAEFTRVLASDGTLSPAVRISRPGYTFAGGQVAVTPAGRAVFAWNEYKDGKVTVLARGRDADGTLRPPQVLAAADVDQPYIFGGYGLAIAPDGEAVVSWQSGGALLAQMRARGGALGPVRAITTMPIYGWDQGIDAQGNLVFAWDAPADSKSRIFVRTQRADGTFSPTKAVSIAGYWASLGQVAVTPGGAAAVGWTLGRKGFAIQAVFGP
jgi:DNA-binding beta-propeller fold protein YncE